MLIWKSVKTKRKAKSFCWYLTMVNDFKNQKQPLRGILLILKNHRKLLKILAKPFKNNIFVNLVFIVLSYKTVARNIRWTKFCCLILKDSDEICRYSIIKIHVFHLYVKRTSLLNEVAKYLKYHKPLKCSSSLQLS